MQKTKNVDTVRERERERELQFSKTIIFSWNSNKNDNRKIKGENTFIHNERRQTTKIKILPKTGKP